MKLSAPAPTPAPAPTLPTPVTTISVSWDDSILKRRAAVGLSLAEGGNRAVSAFADRSAFQTARYEYGRANSYEKAIIDTFAGIFTAREAALGELKSNIAMDAKFTPSAGEFDVRIDRPGAASDLRYVGVLEGMPAAIRDVIESARGFRRYVIG